MADGHGFNESAEEIWVAKSRADWDEVSSVMSLPEWMTKKFI